MITDSRRAIEALRAGVPNRAAIRRMGIGREGIAEAFAARMSDPFGVDSARPGDLVLIQADVAEEAMPWLTEKYGSRLRETTLDEMAAAELARRR